MSFSASVPCSLAIRAGSTEPASKLFSGRLLVEVMKVVQLDGKCWPLGSECIARQSHCANIIESMRCVNEQ